MMLRKVFGLLMTAGAAAATLTAFEVTPRIYPADTEATITFRPVTEWEKKNFRSLKVEYISGGKSHSDGSGPWTDNQKLKPVVDDNGITVTIMLRGEQRHSFLFWAPPQKPADPKKKPARPQPKIEQVMTLKPDLFALRPFRGNIHQHSKVSDGRWEPEEHITHARRVGFDFVSVTDHGTYDQNPRVIAAAAESGSGLEVYPGEEMHNYGAVLHAVCLGAPKRMSLTGKYAEDLTELAEGSAKVAEEIRKEFPQASKEDIRFAAEATFLARRARRHGATVIYAHPYWFTKGRLQSPEFMTRYILTHNDFDAVEICNDGIATSYNPPIAALLYELAYTSGRRWPVSSASDCHNVASDYYKRNFNVIFAKDCTLASFRDALVNYRSTAGYLTRGAKGDGPVYYFGPLRFIDYSQFLHDCGYWKNHLKICLRQSELLAKFVAGDKSVVPEIRKCAEEIDALRESLFFRPAK